MRTLDDHRHRYVEVTGKLNLGRLDRIEARRKVKLGSKGGTISIVTSSEQTSSGLPITGNDLTAEPLLEVAAFTPLGERCPSP
jgi:hypothetical protein